ncbi:hypothetical protein LTR49_027887 [Elasticomyces elasticus]|nr:hypothetical protein LTR49_027887 [Elasticomyces elasticus]
MRGGLIALLYRKLLDVETGFAPESAPAALASVDMEKITFGLHSLHDTWAGMIEMCIAAYLLGSRLHLTAIGPILVCIVCVVLGAVIAIIGGRAQRRWLEATETRVDLTSDTLRRFRALKLAGFSEVVESRISELRAAEVEESKGFRKCLIGMVTMSYLSMVAAPVLGLGLFGLLPDIRGPLTFDASLVFSSLTLLTLLSQAVSSVVYAITSLLSSMSAIERYRLYMRHGTHRDPRLIARNPPTLDFADHFDGAHSNIDISRSAAGSASTLVLPPLSDEWEGALEHFRLTSLKQTYVPHCVILDCAYIGWKSNVELIKNCTMSVHQSQFLGITGPVSCGKTTLVEALVGQAMLSSGRLVTTFKRAAYCAQSPWLTYGTVRQNIIGSLPFDAAWYAIVLDACALTQDIAGMPLGNESIIGSDGMKISGGQRKRIALARAVYTGFDVLVLDDVFSGLDPETVEHVVRKLFAPSGLLRRQKRTVFLVANHQHVLDHMDAVLKLSTGGESIFSIREDSKAFTVQELARPDDGMMSETDIFPAGPNSTDGQTRLLMERLSPISTNHEAITQRGDTNTYKLYFSVSGWGNCVRFLACCLGLVLGLNLPQFWISFWVSDAIKGLGKAGYFGVYMGFGIFAMICLILGAMASIAHMSDLDVAEVLNRFSQDLSIIDTDVPLSIFGTVFALIATLVQAVFLCISSKYLVAVVPFLAAALYLVQKFYIRTSRQLRILDIEAKVPMLSHFLDTMCGLTTIRSAAWEEAFHSSLLKILDDSQRPFYLLFCIQVWLTLVLDLFNASLAVLLVAVVISLRDSYNTAFLGVALTSIVSFGSTLNALVENWTTLETAIQAITRIQEYSLTTVAETPGDKKNPSSVAWPQNGRIRYENVCASYGYGLLFVYSLISCSLASSNRDATVLEHLSFELEPGQRIGVCGRTGSGKSSFLATLSQALTVDSGHIIIDGEDIHHLPEELVRSRILNVPQDTFTTDGTVRYNLDPIRARPDLEIIAALEVVCLWNALQPLGGLAAPANSGLSAGQRQALGLARAFLQGGSIIAMDESTSSMDHETEAIVRKAIYETFQSQTIFIVSHKVENLLGCDRIMVFDEGQLVEFDTLDALRHDLNSRFRQVFLGTELDCGHHCTELHVHGNNTSQRRDH